MTEISFRLSRNFCALGVVIALTVPVASAQTILSRPEKVSRTHAKHFIFQSQGQVICQIAPGYYFVFETSTDESFVANSEQMQKAKLDGSARKLYDDFGDPEIAKNMEKLQQLLSEIPEPKQPAVKVRVISEGPTPIVGDVLSMFKAAMDLGFPCYLPVKKLPATVQLSSELGVRNIVFDSSPDIPSLPWQNFDDLETVGIDVLERSSPMLPKRQ